LLFISKQTSFLFQTTAGTYSAAKWLSDESEFVIRCPRNSEILLLEANAHYLSDLDQRVDDIKTEVLRLIEQNCPLKYECRFRTVQMEGVYYQAMYQCPLGVPRLPDLSTTYLPTTQTCKIDYSIKF